MEERVGFLKPLTYSGTPTTTAKREATKFILSSMLFASYVRRRAQTLVYPLLLGWVVVRRQPLEKKTGNFFLPLEGRNFVIS